MCSLFQCQRTYNECFEEKELCLFAKFYISNISVNDSPKVKRTNFFMIFPTVQDIWKNYRLLISMFFWVCKQYVKAKACSACKIGYVSQRQTEVNKSDKNKKKSFLFEFSFKQWSVGAWSLCVVRRLNSHIQHLNSAYRATCTYLTAHYVTWQSVF